MGQRASNTATITFNETEIPADHLIGEENKGFKIAMMTLDRTRPGVAAMATGIARAAFEFATNYSKERIQFGVPIAMHQAIQFMIADMATVTLAPGHLAVRRAARPGAPQHARVLARQALRGRHAAMEVTTDAVQVYGGYGFIKDYPVEKLMRDAKIMQLYEGTSADPAARHCARDAASAAHRGACHRLIEIGCYRPRCDDSAHGRERHACMVPRAARRDRGLPVRA